MILLDGGLFVCVDGSLAAIVLYTHISVDVVIVTNDPVCMSS